MKITDIYQKYNIIKNLQLHHLRVAAVAKLIAENFDIEIDVQTIVQTCLVHDMGNLLKFSFDYNPESFEPEGVSYWQNIKRNMADKYGNDEHIATYKIAQEIGVSDKVLNILPQLGFGNAEATAKNNDYAVKICLYSDMRVAPEGVTSLLERVDSGVARFKKNKPDEAAKNSPQKLINLRNAIIEVEKQIFAHTKITAEQIQTENIAPIIDELINFDL